MVQFLAYFLFFMYLMIIVKRFFRLCKIISCLHILVDFLNSATINSNGSLNKKDNFNEKLNKVLSKYPDISDFTNIYSPYLSYSQTDKEKYKNSYFLYTELSMQRNYLRKELKEAFNPLIAIKATFSIPVSLMNFLGIKPNITFANFINIAAWILVYMLSMFESEIKELFIALFKNLIHT